MDSFVIRKDSSKSKRPERDIDDPGYDRKATKKSKSDNSDKSSKVRERKSNENDSPIIDVQSDTADEDVVDIDKLKSKPALIENLHYMSYSSSQHPAFKHCRRLLQPLFRRTESNHNTSTPYTHVCLLCLEDENKAIRLAFIKCGEFTDWTKRKSSNFTTHLKNIHNMDFNNIDKSESTSIKSNVFGQLTSYVGQSSSSNSFLLSVSEFIIDEGLPLNTTEKDSFINMFRHGNCRYNLPSQYILCQIIEQMHKCFLHLLKRDITSSLNDCITNDGYPLPCISIYQDGLDMGNDYAVGFGLSYISNDFSFRNVPLFIETNISSSKASTVSEIIKKRLEDEFNVDMRYVSMCISDTTSSSLLVSDELIEEQSNGCVMHILNLITSRLVGLKPLRVNNGVKEYFDVGKNLVENIVTISQFFETSKHINALAPYLTKCGMDKRLKLNSFSSTRPSSSNQMMLKAIKMKPAIQLFIDDVKRKREYSDLVMAYNLIDWNILCEFQAIIDIIDQWIIILQSASRPSLGYGLIGFLTIIKDLREGPLEVINIVDYEERIFEDNTLIITSPDIQEADDGVKMVKMSVLPKNMSPTSLTVINTAIDLLKLYLEKDTLNTSNCLPAIFVDPIARILLEQLSQEHHKTAKQMVSKIILELSPSSQANENEEDAIKSSNDKKEKILLRSKKDNISSKDEIQIYMDCDLPETWPNEIDSVTSQTVISLFNICNPLEFWKVQHRNFKLLVRVAKHFLCGTATTASQERFFSIVSLVRNPQRTSLKKKRLESLTMLRCNKKLFKELRIKYNHNNYPEFKNEELTWSLLEDDSD